MKLAKLMILATDLETAKAFYCGVLGFPQISQNESELELAHEGADISIFKCTENAVPDFYVRAPAPYLSSRSSRSTTNSPAFGPRAFRSFTSGPA